MEYSNRAREGGRVEGGERSSNTLCTMCMNISLYKLAVSSPKPGCLRLKIFDESAFGDYKWSKETVLIECWNTKSYYEPDLEALRYWFQHFPCSMILLLFSLLRLFIDHLRKLVQIWENILFFRIGAKF